MLLQLLIELDFLPRLFGNGLDNQISVAERLVPITRQLDACTRRSDLCDQRVELLGRGALIGEATRPLRRVGFRRLKCGSATRRSH